MTENKPKNDKKDIPKPQRKEKSWIKLGDLYDLKKMCKEKGLKLKD